ncbi:MAG: class I SAM-dependent methyltransferase [Polyangiaceae bacterium]
MSTQSLGVSEPLQRYLLDQAREPELLRRLREETARMPHGGMQISPEQGSFMRFLVRLVGAQRYLEVGVFTGYSSLSVAHALPDSGKVVACDVSAEWTSVARRYFEEAKLAHKFELRLGPALATLKELHAARQVFDFAFIDADKENYAAYYELCLDLVRPGGLVAVDNALWDGKARRSQRARRQYARDP